MLNAEKVLAYLGDLYKFYTRFKLIEARYRQLTVHMILHLNPEPLLARIE